MKTTTTKIAKKPKDNSKSGGRGRAIDGNSKPGDTRESVEAIYQQWRSQRPDIDPYPALIYGPISRIQSGFTARIDKVLKPYKLVRGTFDVLTALRRIGSPYCLSPKQLTDHLFLSGAGLNGRLNILEGVGYIARLPEPKDRRTLRIQLTASGQRVVNSLTPKLFELQWASLAKFSASDRKAFSDYLIRLADELAD